MLGYKPSIDALGVTASELKRQGSPDEQGMVEQWVDGVLQRWEDVVGAMEERKVCKGQGCVCVCVCVCMCEACAKGVRVHVLCVHACDGVCACV